MILSPVLLENTIYPGLKAELSAGTGDVVRRKSKPTMVSRRPFRVVLYWFV